MHHSTNILLGSQPFPTRINGHLFSFFSDEWTFLIQHGSQLLTAAPFGHYLYKTTAVSLHHLWWHIYCQNIWKQIAKATTRGDYTHDQMIVLYPINHKYTIPWDRSVISTDDQGRRCHVNTTHVPFMCQCLFADLLLNTEKIALFIAGMAPSSCGAALMSSTH